MEGLGLIGLAHALHDEAAGWIPALEVLFYLRCASRPELRIARDVIFAASAPAEMVKHTRQVMAAPASDWRDECLAAVVTWFRRAGPPERKAFLAAIAHGGLA